MSDFSIDLFIMVQLGMDLFGKLVKYIFVGALNSAFAYSLFALFLFVDIHYRLSVLLTLIIGIMFNFKTVGRIVFESRDNRLILRFVLVYLIAYVIGILGLEILQKQGVSMYLGGILLMPIGAIVSFILFNLYVFRKK